MFDLRQNPDRRWCADPGQGQKNTGHPFRCPALVEEGGFEPPKLTQQIYSLSPLATRELLRVKLELVDGLEPPAC